METCERQENDTESDGAAEELTFTFDQLSERAKDHARDNHRTTYPPEHDWWEHVYEEAVRFGALIGINVDTYARKTKSGHVFHEPRIHFSGFGMQGEGASFVGNYRYVPDAVNAIKQETDDEELLSIAQRLTMMQLTHRLLGLEPFGASINTRGNYSHSGTMYVETIHADDDGIDFTTLPEIEDEVQQLMRDFADWIFGNLEAENEYLNSDEYIDERLSDDSFDERGELV